MCCELYCGKTDNYDLDMVRWVNNKVFNEDFFINVYIWGAFAKIACLYCKFNNKMLRFCSYKISFFLRNIHTGYIFVRLWCIDTKLVILYYNN